MKVNPRVFPWLTGLIVVFLIFCLLHIGEYFLYLVAPERQFPKNGIFNEVRYTWGHPVKHNNLGFRDDHDYEIPKPEGVFRILVLGDSLTWGAGLAVEERYTNRLEKALTKQFPEKNIDVLNLAFSGAPTIFYRDRLEKFKDKLDPDLIIVGFCLNDPQPKGENYSIEREKFQATLQDVQRKFGKLGLHHIGKEVVTGIYRVLEKFDIIPPWYIGLDRVYNKNSTEWKSFVQALRDIKTVSDQYGLPAPIFMVLNQGVFADRPTDYNNPDNVLEYYLKWYQQAEQAAQEIGFVTTNVERELRDSYTEKSMAVNPLDGHPNADLNVFYANALFKKIHDILQ